MAIGDNQIGTEGAILKRSSQCLTLTGAIPTTGLVLDIRIPRGALVSHIDFFTDTVATGSETIDVGWTEGKFNLPGTQTGLVDEAADADGFGTLSNANLKSLGRNAIYGGAGLQKKRFTAPVFVTLTPSAATTQTAGNMIFNLYYVVD